MTTLFDATLSLAQLITGVRKGTATGASTTVITDALATWVTDVFKGGTIWIHSTAITALISSNTSTAITIPTLSGAPTSTTPYSLANKDYPRDVLRKSINQALEDLYLAYVETSYTLVASQYQYTLSPVNALHVEIETSVGSGIYQPCQVWNEVEGALRFQEGAIWMHPGAKVRVRTRKSHADLTSDADIIPASVDPVTLKWRACVNALQWGLTIYGQDTAKQIMPLMQKAEAEASRRSIPRPIRQARVSGW